MPYLLFTLYQEIEPAASTAAHREYGRIAAAQTAAFRLLPANDPDPERKLRIGYLSGDLRGHSVTRNLSPLVTAHDGSRFDVYYYANGGQEDEMTRQLRAGAAGWRDITFLSNADAARTIHGDRIDILVALAGHLDSNRPLIPAHRPAPIQISFHDPVTSGLEQMDYLIGDRFLTPPRLRGNFVERPLRLPSYYLHAPIERAPDPGPLPALAAGYVTFGSFNNPMKISDGTFQMWLSVLARIPESRLLLKYQNAFASPDLRERLCGMAGARGLDPNRLIFEAEHDGIGSHLGRYRRIDMALDTYPFTGSTTTFEALWMGVPVVTRAGANMVSRWSGSILSALGHRDLIADDPAAFVETAAAWARDLERLSDFRRTARARIAASPLCDGRLRARQVERLYRAVWRRWCRAQSRPRGPGGP
jgi:protein O-GlcNAc transferase